MKKTKIAGILALIILAVILILPYITSCTIIDEETKNANSNEDGADANYANSDEGEIETNTANSNDGKINAVTVKILVNGYDADKDSLETIRELIYDTYGMNAQITAYDSAGSWDDNKIATKLLAGDTDFDMYTLSSNLVPYYAKNNACLDLSSSKGIVDNFSNMFDGLLDICSVEEKLCGVPVRLNMFYNMWDCNIELAEKLGLDIASLSTKKITWHEFYDFAAEAKAKADELGITDFYVLSAWGEDIDPKIWHYMTNYLDYTNKKIENKTTEYIAYLNLYKKMQDEGLISKDFAFTARDSILFTMTGAFSYKACDRQPFPNPLITDGDSYLVEPLMLAINPKSPNIEAAKKYLEYATSLPVLQKRVDDYLLKDWDLYEYSDPAGIEMGVGIATTNGHEVVKFIIKNGKRFYGNDDIYNEIQADAQLLKERKMSIEDFAQKLYQKSKMIIEE